MCNCVGFCSNCLKDKLITCLSALNKIQNIFFLLGLCSFPKEKVSMIKSVKYFACAILSTCNHKLSHTWHKCRMPAINLENEVEEFQMVRQTIDTFAVCSRIWDYNSFSKGNELVLINMNSA